jgi:hypothetical protein
LSILQDEQDRQKAQVCGIVPLNEKLIIESPILVLDN